ncbi:hypothetical protein EFR84_23450 [Rhizobium chutanense]|uniref:Uncharacterized protein n=1 Tax=Rhizobium chutanense TaxID=2035448 RepID=A0A432NPB0_9HYPH|nr:hypothetical protein EFR84_23450 [Rhizobium chutanense]
MSEAWLHCPGPFRSQGSRAVPKRTRPFQPTCRARRPARRHAHGAGIHQAIPATGRPDRPPPTR